MNDERVCAVAVTYNNAETIDMMLGSLATQQDHVASIVIVDNGSKDDTLARIRANMPAFNLPVRVARGSNVGFAAGIRTAVSITPSSEHPILILNPDVILARGVIRSMLKVVECDPSVGIVTAPLAMRTGEPDTASVRRLPTFGMASVYAVLGRLTPRTYRYNSITLAHDPNTKYASWGEVAWSTIEATSGALMLVSRAFKPGREIFDTAYWMYGEDLQLCADAKRLGYSVAMIDGPASLHLKGTSSGWPRSFKSNVEFHRAMYVYYRRNLEKTRVLRPVVLLGILGRFTISLSVGIAASRGRIRQ